MPYISREQRVELDRWLSKLELPRWKLGDLNYVITKHLLNTNPENYQDYDTLIGLLECIKLEFYRRAVAPYEDRKRDENGEVYY